MSGYEKMTHADDDELDPFEYRLLGHIRRRAGASGSCFASISTMAKMCRMSPPKVRDALASLQKKHGRIAIEERPGSSHLIILTPVKNDRGTPARNDMGTPVENCRGDAEPLQKTTEGPCKKQQDTPAKNSRTPLQETIDEENTVRKHHKKTPQEGVVREVEDYLRAKGINLNGKVLRGAQGASKHQLERLWAEKQNLPNAQGVFVNAMARGEWRKFSRENSSSAEGYRRVNEIMRELQRKTEWKPSDEVPVQTVQTGQRVS